MLRTVHELPHLSMEELCVAFGLGRGWVDQGIDQQLAVVQESRGNTIEKVHFLGPRMEDDEGGVFEKPCEHKDPVKSEPDGLGITVAGGKVVAGILNGLDDAFRPEFLEWQEADEQLTAPTETDAADGTSVAQPLQGTAERGSNGCRDDDGSGFLCVYCSE